MILTSELSDQEAATLATHPAGADLPLPRYLAEPSAVTAHRPKKSAYGLLAQYGPGPTAEEIDENRHQMFARFAGNS